MPAPRRLTELPFHHLLAPPEEPPTPTSEHELAHFDRADYSSTQAEHSVFRQCAFSTVDFTGARLRWTRLQDTWLHGCTLTSAEAIDSDWLDVELTTSVLAGTVAYDSRLKRVIFHGCKLAGVNFRGATLDDVTFVDCALGDVDFSGATLKRVRFPRSSLLEVTFENTTLTRVDLRDAAEIDLRLSAGSLNGLTISSAQLALLAPSFAQALGITVAD